MGRSIKKGPYVDPKLLDKIVKMNEANEKKVLKTCNLFEVRLPSCGDLNRFYENI